mmetsp:Transcript_38120/g.73104  ORF Transcript_38120/g.73104 Transcript_38120/m.73104 type:complete len:553 (-) Transcript_38120:301-1959(-)|eukprot:CAMPEP_0114231902 /NCGR_PEP_ID=MMETSP0058-20121206/4311_1 /TAXON_ID=36894 /ORGANISM="Pyramimonas parkeae, CCMP726" /LENGTH=552 /DNA_ID=CAMNT_0001343321 /DNA_START=139 /DNA_END=1797 /DNA_ORIENTATION=+
MSSGAHARVRDQDVDDPCLQARLLQDGLRDGESWVPREVSAEEAIAMAGAWGTFQRRQTIALSLAMGFDAMAIYLAVFIARPPSMRCTSTGATGAGACDCPDGVVEYLPTYTYDSFVSEYRLGCHDVAWVPQLVDSMYFVGWSVGVTVMGALIDRVGRRKCFMACSYGAAVSTALLCIPGFTPSWEQLAGVRFLVGMFSGTRNMPGYLLVTEMVDATLRGPVSGIVWATWGTCVALLAGLAYGVDAMYHAVLAHNDYPSSSWLVAFLHWLPSWRLLCVAVGILQLLPSLVPRHWIRDSPSYLLSRGWTHSAHRVLQAVAKVNGKTLPDNLEFVNALQDNGLSPEDSVTVVEPDKPSPVRVLLSGAKFLDRPLWLITVVIVSAYFATSFVFYGLTLNSGSFTSNIYLSFFISSVMQVPAYAATGPIVDFFGRRNSLAGSLLVAGTLCLLFVYLPPSPVVSTLVFVGVMHMAYAFSGIFPYTVELFPTKYRGVAFGFCQLSARLSSILAPFVPSLGEINPTLPLLVYGSVAVVSGASMLVLPETKGLQLQEDLE